MSPSADQLLRLVRLIPLAARPEGVRLPDAARMCGVEERDIQRDFTLLAERSWYLPPGRTDDFQILLEGDRIRVYAPPAFHRPVRLVLAELVACALALRCAGLGSEEAAELCRRVEAALALESMESDGPSPPATDEVQFALRHTTVDELHGALSRAVVHRRRVRFGYVKDGAEAPEVRRLEPWRIVHAEGEAYLIGHDLDRDEPRLFRVDRILGVDVTDEACSAPVPDTPEEVQDDGSVRLIVGEGDERWAEVRYSPRVARWVRERYEGQDAEDGAYVVQHRLLTDGWVVRHVLAYGGEAEVVAPGALRTAVVEAVDGSGSVQQEPSARGLKP